MLRPVVGPQVMPSSHPHGFPHGHQNPAGLHPAQMMTQAQAFYMQQQQAMGSSSTLVGSVGVNNPTSGHLGVMGPAGIAAPGASHARVSGASYAATAAVMPAYGHGSDATIPPMMQSLMLDRMRAAQGYGSVGAVAAAAMCAALQQSHHVASTAANAASQRANISRNKHVRSPSSAITTDLADASPLRNTPNTEHSRLTPDHETDRLTVPPSPRLSPSSHHSSLISPTGSANSVHDSSTEIREETSTKKDTEVIRHGFPAHTTHPPPLIPSHGPMNLPARSPGNPGPLAQRYAHNLALSRAVAANGMPPFDLRLYNPLAAYAGYMFSQQDVDTLLYGYARNKTDSQGANRPTGPAAERDSSEMEETKATTEDAVDEKKSKVTGHALSGLRINHLSHGIDRILGGEDSAEQASPLLSPVSPYTPTTGNTTGNLSTLHPAFKAGYHQRESEATAVDPSTLDLPEGIGLFRTTFAGTPHYGIFCEKTLVQKGKRFGPFQGRQVNTSEIKSRDDNSFMWEIFKKGHLSHFVDGRGTTGNWMSYVNCARYAQEQNLLAVQEKGEIFYEVCKDITQGTELLVWYGESYLQFMGIPIALKDMEDTTATEDVDNNAGYQCDRCGKMFAYEYYRDKHLKYTRCVDQGDRKYPCHLCTRSFEKRDRLRIHILHVHEKHRPHKCSVCGKSFSQSSSLNKHMRVHSGERPYKCVYCSKAFTASSILRTHIRQHSGEKPFKCKHCGKAFASHAAHDSHVRRTHSKERPCVCPVCGRAYSQMYELKFHMEVHRNTNEVSSFRASKMLERDEKRDDRYQIASLPGSTGNHDLNMNTKVEDQDPVDVVGLGADEGVLAN